MLPNISRWPASKDKHEPLDIIGFIDLLLERERNVEKSASKCSRANTGHEMLQFESKEL